MTDSRWQHPLPAPPEQPRISKVPTGLGSEPLNIVILGASYAGLSCAHHFLDHTINRLRTTKRAPNYRLVIVSLSTDLYWNIGAPRALVSPDLIKHEDLFLPIEPAFHRHRAHNFSIVQGEAIGMDPSARTITIECIDNTAQKRATQINNRSSRQIRPASSAGLGPKMQTISYHALVMATGSSTHSSLLSLHGPHLRTMGELTTIHARIAAAKSIIVCGGGCSGVETAGQLATYLNYSCHWPIKKRSKNAKRILLITGADRCLPTQKPKIGAKAEQMLRKLGVEVVHGVRVIAAKEDYDLTGQTKVELNDNTSLIADVYIPCTGVEPNSGYVPTELKDARGYIVTNRSTLRIEHPIAGVRTYAIGDVASYSRNNILDVYAAVPVLMQSLLNDLLSHEYQLAALSGDGQHEGEELLDMSYVQRRSGSQLCPISRFGGVASISDTPIPKLFVHLLKGYDYRVRKAKKVVVDGASPYLVRSRHI